jgi:carotenoid 9,10(9',10')-cleavage dioxygenase 1
LETSDLRVDGRVPASLIGGQFVRNGPNPRYVPRGSYHWFDGDGMLHGTHFRGGAANQVSYTNRYVRTERFLEEKAAKGAVHFKLGDMMEAEGLVTMLVWRMLQRFPFVRSMRGRGTANTALTYHDNRLLALVESDLPYEVSAPR